MTNNSTTNVSSFQKTLLTRESQMVISEREGGNNKSSKLGNERGKKIGMLHPL